MADHVVTTHVYVYTFDFINLVKVIVIQLGIGLACAGGNEDCLTGFRAENIFTVSVFKSAVSRPLRVRARRVPVRPSLCAEMPDIYCGLPRARALLRPRCH